MAGTHKPRQLYGAHHQPSNDGSSNHPTASNPRTAKDRRPRYGERHTAGRARREATPPTLIVTVAARRRLDRVLNRSRPFAPEVRGSRDGVFRQFGARTEWHQLP